MECLWRALGARALLRPRAARRAREVPTRAPQIGALLRRPGDRGDRRAHRVVLGRARGASSGARADQGRERVPALRRRDDLLARGTQIDVEHVNFLITDPRGIEEVVLHLDGDGGRISLPVALAAEHDEHERIVELRLYFSSWPLTGRHANRPPLLQPEPDLHAADVVGEYQRALMSGDVDAILATFEPHGSMREPAGGAYVHRGTDELRALYELFFSNGGGIPLEHCSVTHDGRACALEDSVVAWGRTELPPEAGIAVYVRGDSGRLPAARVYDDSDPPLSSHA